MRLGQAQRTQHISFNYGRRGQKEDRRAVEEVPQGREKRNNDRNIKNKTLPPFWKPIPILGLPIMIKVIWGGQSPIFKRLAIWVIN